MNIFFDNSHALSGTTNNETCRDFHINSYEYLKNLMASKKTEREKSQTASLTKVNLRLLPLSKIVK
ncbi:MAG: hypothetical protein HQK63_11740 [Desulfamplus sp.]|nr:hypothetical protein [Desulfamplus sp.]